eukprot:TRINITY_DN4129_c0_g1_i1.p1 TRINITY_DN4129_c0_g1~~TRINITY_DN4129_c0_g1_i1.p1  ORF type:complete len:658 (-),score=71.51 TRINITY_DN4129_c0_g1_i1:133-2106(-)
MDLDLLKSLIECAICCDFLEEPAEAPCCHNLFCHECLVAWNRSSRGACPSCRKPLNLDALLKNIPIQRFVEGMPVDCPHKLQGCDARPTRSDLAKHRELCSFSKAAMETLRSQKSKDLREKLQKMLRDRPSDLLSYGMDLVELARELFEVGDYKSVEEIAQRLSQIAISIKEPQFEISSSYLLASVNKAEARYDAALELFQRTKRAAMEAGDTNEANNRKNVQDCLIHIGEVYLKQGKFLEAEQQYQEALSHVTSDQEKGEILTQLGLVAKKCSDYDKAIKYYGQAMELLSAEHPVWFELVTNLGDVHRKRENFGEARTLYSQALQKIKTTYGDMHPQIAEIRNAVGMLNKKEGHYEAALEDYKTALQVARFYFGASHPSIGIYLNNLGDIYRKQGNFNKAEGIYSQALPMLEKSLGKEHVEVAEVLNSMGLVLKKRADYDGAEKLYRRAIDIIEKTFGRGHYKIGIYMNNLADISRKHARHLQALDMYKTALDIIERTLGPTHSEAAEVLYNMGLVQHQLGKYDESQRLYMRAQEIVKKELGERHYKIGMILNSLAMAEMMLNNYEAAHGHLREGLDILIECLGRDHVEVSDCYTNLGDVCMKLVCEKNQIAQLEEAKKNYKFALRIVERAFGSTHTKCQQLESLLFICDQYNSLT